MKKFAGDIIILHMYQKSEYMIYGSNFLRFKNFLSFCAIFCPFNTPTPKNQNFQIFFALLAP